MITRLLSAPRELVFEVWTNPDHIKNWWGPNGFTSTIHKMDVNAGGEWEFILHGPDGTDYKNKCVFIEVKSPERIVYDHISGPKFRSEITFDALGMKTLLTMRMLFDSAEELEKTIKTFGADEGLKQNIERLKTYLEGVESI